MAGFKKSDHKMTMREEARQKVRPRTDAKGVKQYRSDVDKGLGTLRKLSAEGGDGAAKRYKSELTYLINNYMPKYDARIEQLIDLWRRSGDPEYDPTIRVKLRRARRDHMSKTNPF